jgi:hypothetical protein
MASRRGAAAPQEPRVEPGRPSGLQGLLRLGNPAALPILDRGGAVLHDEQVEPAANADGWIAPLGGSAVPGHGERHLDARDAVQREGRAAEPRREQRRRLSIEARGCGGHRIAGMERPGERAKRLRPGGLPPCEGLAHVGLEQRVAREPEEQRVLVRLGSRQPVHVLEPVGPGTAIPHLEPGGAERGQGGSDDRACRGFSDVRVRHWTVPHIRTGSVVTVAPRRRPASRRKREGESRIGRPQSLRSAQTERTRRRLARVMPT